METVKMAEAPPPLQWNFSNWKALEADIGNSAAHFDEIPPADVNKVEGSDRNSSDAYDGDASDSPTSFDDAYDDAYYDAYNDQYNDEDGDYY